MPERVQDTSSSLGTLLRLVPEWIPFRSESVACGVFCSFPLCSPHVEIPNPGRPWMCNLCLASCISRRRKRCVSGVRSAALKVRRAHLSADHSITRVNNVRAPGSRGQVLPELRMVSLHVGHRGKGALSKSPERTYQHNKDISCALAALLHALRRQIQATPRCAHEIRCKPSLVCLWEVDLRQREEKTEGS